MVENEDGPGPYGAKGVSEGALLCTAPALAAAVTDATGVRIRDLPLTPERVWSHLRQAESGPTSGARAGAGGSGRS
jgi:CO/xanthine dehydrogenase Mo-binding subunit